METKKNPKIELARRIVEKTGTSLFLTGKAGTGKTTFLRNLRNSTRKRIIVTAPTGIAAINAGGVTLHSFFQLDFGIFVPGKTTREKYRFSKEKLKMIRGMDLLVIDEVSMVRADLLDAVDDALRRLRDRTKPFGGVQLLLIGDLQQLPPVAKDEEEAILRQHYASNYFFDSNALKQIHYETVELDEVYRQDDKEFLEILNSIRDNKATQATLDKLNERVRHDVDSSDYEGYIRLTTHNKLAASINEEKLGRLRTPEKSFECRIEGRFPESSYPAEQTLRLKEGAQVMFIKNDNNHPRAFYNGMIGRVVAIDEKEGIAVRPMDGGEIITVQPMEWENMVYSINEETKEIVEKREGSFYQYPLKAAWAVTIHKSQGLTFDRAIMDVSRSFAHGQTYVALSRCRNLKGLVLEKPIPRNAIINDTMVNRYMESHTSEGIDETHLEELERSYKIRLLDDLFSFRQLFAAMEGVVRIYQENFGRTNPGLVSEWSNTYESLKSEINDVSDKFRIQYSRLASQGIEKDQELQERVKAASNYFLGKMQPLSKLLGNAQTESTNKTVRQKLGDRLDLFRDLLNSKILLLNSFRAHDFNVDIYLDLKAEAMLKEPGYSLVKKPAKAKKEAEKRMKAEKKVSDPRTPKIPSWQITYELIKNGKNIAEVAEERCLADSTILGHLTKNVSREELKSLLPRLVKTEALHLLEQYAKEHPETDKTSTEIIEALGGVPNWEEVRLVLTAYGCRYRAPFTANEPPTNYGNAEDFLEA